MADDSVFHAAKEEICKYEVVYTQVPGHCVSITAIPQSNWDSEVTGLMSEKYECIREMVVNLFYQLTEEQQSALMWLCEGLFPSDYTHDGGAAHD